MERLHAVERGLARARVARDIAGARRPCTVERCEWRGGSIRWPAWAACVPAAALSGQPFRVAHVHAPSRSSYADGVWSAGVARLQSAAHVCESARCSESDGGMPALPDAVCCRLPRSNGFLTARARPYEGQLAASSMLRATALEAAQGDTRCRETGLEPSALCSTRRARVVCLRGIEQPPLIYMSLLTPLA